MFHMYKQTHHSYYSHIYYGMLLFIRQFLLKHYVDVIKWNKKKYNEN